MRTPDRALSAGIRRLLIGLLLAITTVAAQPAAQSASTYYVYLPIVLKAPILSSMEQQVVDLTNAQRRQAGCPNLTVSPELTQAARRHTEDMAIHDFLSHSSSDGSLLGDRVRAVGYYPFSSLGENVAGGFETAEQVMAGWMWSSGHRANILNCKFRDIGVSYVSIVRANGDVDRYWTQDFGTR